jgi:serine/threonine protein phosphatase PrpC
METDKAVACQSIRLRPERDESCELDIALISTQGKGAVNEDYVGVRLGDVAQRASKGTAIVLADGMSGGSGGRVAAELAVRSFVEAYYDLPDTLSPAQAASRALEAIHRWLHQIGRTDPALNLMAASFGALIVRGRSALLIAAGDVRLYLLRDGTLSQLGEDDVLRVTFGSYIAHAVGLHASLVTRIDVTELQEGDRLLLCSDGLYRRPGMRSMLALMRADVAPEASVEALVKLAREHGSTDDVSAVLVDVKRIPELDYGYLERVMGELPILAVPACGDVVDGYALVSLLSDGYYSRVFVGHDQADPQTPLAIKFPKPRVAQDDNLRHAVVRERWLAGKLDGAHVLAPLAIDSARQTRLYVIMPFADGVPLETVITQAPLSLTQGLRVAQRLAQAIHALNRQNIFHRDIKPENVMVMRDGGIKLLDLGFAYMPGVLAPAPDTAPGTPAYMAPELMKGSPGDARSEVFAFGITLYRAFCFGRLPYGFNGRVPLRHHRPDLPQWLDLVLEKATQSDPERRYQDALEVCADLDLYAASGDDQQPRRGALIERNPVLFWKSVSLVLGLGLLAALLRQVH